MKKPKENAKRWLREAEHTLAQAEQTYKNKIWNLVCFLSEQTAQKALKAVLYYNGERFINIHSIVELVREAATKHPELIKFARDGGILDQYYLSSRYPDAVAEPAIPAEIFVDKQAGDSIKIAKKIFEKCKRIIV